ncbi:MAG: hypothetical protein ABR976_06645 [Terracidiphilus sp.]|jgi:hypothetical protein
MLKDMHRNDDVGGFVWQIDLLNVEDHAGAAREQIGGSVINNILRDEFRQTILWSEMYQASDAGQQMKTFNREV